MRRTFDGPPGPPRDRDRAAAISRWLDSARHDAAYAVRNLMRQPGFAAVVVLVLGTVIGLHATLATVIAGVILRPWPGVAAAASVVRLFPIATSGHVGAFSADDYRVIAERTRSLAGVIAMTSDDVRVGHSSGDADGVRTVSALLVSGRFFDLLGVGTAAGRGFADADDRSGDPRAVVVLANAFWRARFAADASVIGIDGLAVVTFELPPDAYDDARRRALVADLTDSLRQSPPPGIDAFGFATWEPSFIRRGFQALLRPAGEAAERARNVTYVEISPGYLETLGIRLVAGRDFTSNDAGRNVAVINETMARLFWENENPVGRTFVTGRGAPQEVVGVMRDAHTHSLYTVPPLFYQPLRATRTMPKLLVRTRGAVAANELGRLIARLDPRVRIQTVPLSSALEERLRETRNGPLLAGLLGAFALLLSTVGLSGVFAYAVRQRTREIGIRMALGAPPTAVLRLVIADHALALAAGLGVGLAGAVASTLLMRSRLHGVGRFDPVSYLAVAALLSIAGLAASYVPARRAVRIDPAVALRDE